jgi:hypothetical protein
MESKEQRMASVLVVLSLSLIVAHWLACFVFPLVRCRKLGIPAALLWGLGGLALCPLVVVSAQYKRIPSPAWWSWVIRVLLAGAIAWGLVALGDSDWNESTPMVRLKGHFIAMLSPGHIIPAGRQLRCGDEVLDLGSFGRAPFAVAAIVGVVAMFLYRNPVEKTLVLILTSFVASLAADCIYLAQYCAAITANPPDEALIQMLFEYRGIFNLWVPVIVFFWLVVAWSVWDCRPSSPQLTEVASGDA